MPKPGSWLSKQVRRTAILLMTAGLIFVGAVLWAWQNQGVNFARERAVRLGQLAAERTQVQGQLTDSSARLEKIGGTMNAQQEKVRRANEILDERKKLSNTWDKWVGDPAGQKENDEQIARMTVLRDESLTELARLTQDRLQVVVERDGLEHRLSGINAVWAETQADDHAWTHCVKVAWAKLRPWYLLAGLLNFVVWPILCVWWAVRRNGKRRSKRK